MVAHHNWDIQVQDVHNDSPSPNDTKRIMFVVDEKVIFILCQPTLMGIAAVVVDNFETMFGLFLPATSITVTSCLLDTK